MTKSIFSFLVILCACSCIRNLPAVHPAPSKAAPLASYEIPSSTAPISSLNITPFIHRPFVVIDPGHGGKDFGTEAPLKPAFKEKNLNLVTAKILEGYLKYMGYRTLLTRNNDAFVSLDARASLANENHADLFVSIHYNSAPSDQAEGIEVFYFRNDGDKERVVCSKKLADAVLVNLLDMTDAKSRGVKHGNLAVVRKTKMPAILIEGGFMTNNREMNKLADPTYIKTIAWGVARGIQVYLNQTSATPYRTAQN